jgi:hypothetical protein
MSKSNPLVREKIYSYIDLDGDLDAAIALLQTCKRDYGGQYDKLEIVLDAGYNNVDAEIWGTRPENYVEKERRLAEVKRQKEKNKEDLKKTKEKLLKEVAKIEKRLAGKATK